MITGGDSYLCWQQLHLFIAPDTAGTNYVDCVWKENLDGECGLTCNVYVPGNFVGVLSQKE